MVPGPRPSWRKMLCTASGADTYGFCGGAADDCFVHCAHFDLSASVQSQAGTAQKSWIADNFAAVAGNDGTQGILGDRAVDKADGAVGHEHVEIAIEDAAELR